MADVDKKINDYVQVLRNRATARDVRMNRIRAVRGENMDLLFPSAFSEDWPKPIVANFIRTAARDVAESIAPLPAVNCSSGAMKTERDKQRAGTKNKIGHYYLEHSRLAVQMLRAADWYGSYGFMPIYVEPDYDEQCPYMALEDPFGFYYEKNRRGRVVAAAKVWLDYASRLAAMFPEARNQIMGETNKRGASDSTLEVIRFSDNEQTVLYVPQRGMVLAQTENLTSRCPVTVAESPELDDEARGLFDGTIWVQLARARLALLSLEGAEKAVQAPVVVPRDMTDMPIGPDAVWQTDSPQGVRRVPLELPQSAFAMEQVLESEQRISARYPEARGGNLNASVITGRGVQALMGGFDTQIATAQTCIGEALKEALSLAFEIDTKAFGQVRKTIAGVAAGESYEVKYTPAEAIGDNYNAAVTYGFAAGLNPSQALVLLLQLRGDGDIDRDTVRRNLPFDIDVEQMQRNMDTQELRDAMKQGLAAMTSAIGVYAQQGMDPSTIVGPLAAVIKGRADGVPLEDLVLKAFAPKPPPEAAEGEAGAPADQGGTGGGGDNGGAPPFGLNPNGQLRGVAPGQAAMGPGGVPDLQSLIAGLRNGKPALDATVTRRIPAG